MYCKQFVTGELCDFYWQQNLICSDDGNDLSLYENLEKNYVEYTVQKQNTILVFFLKQNFSKNVQIVLQVEQSSL